MVEEVVEGEDFFAFHEFGGVEVIDAAVYSGYRHVFAESADHSVVEGLLTVC